MSFQGLLVRQAVVAIPGESTDRYGSRHPDWDTATYIEEQCWLDQRSSTENRDDGRDAVIVDAVYYAEATSAITEFARVAIDGTTYEVIGRPRAAWTPAGAHHIEADLRAVEG